MSLIAAVLIFGLIILIHEFGHFLDCALGFPAVHKELFAEEAGRSNRFLRDYALTNSREYFAEYFAYFIRYSDNEAKSERMKQLTPRTYAYFADLETLWHE